MMRRGLWAAVVFAPLIFARPAGAIVPGQTDDFQDGTTMNWDNGGVMGVVPVTNIDTGGPAGVGDHYIQVTADGSGVGGRLTCFNRDQWLGDYVGGGVTSIEVDLLNQSAVNLSIRLAFKTGPGNGVQGYLSLPMPLAVGSGWQHFTISLAPADLIPIGGPSPWQTFFIGEVRFIHEVGATDLNGTNVVGQLGIDNIHAVPEPTATILMTGSLLALAAGLVRRKSLRNSFSKKTAIPNS